MADQLIKTSPYNWAVFFIPYLKLNTLQGTNISPQNGIFEDDFIDFPFPQIGYVNSLEGISPVFFGTAQIT